MGCILAIITLLAPRVVMVFIFLLTDWFSRAYETVLWPVLGFIFMPYLTMAYMAMKLHHGAMTGWWLALVIVAAIVDAAHWGGGERQFHWWHHRGA
jgi:hypothetical protein